MEKYSNSVEVRTPEAILVADTSEAFPVDARRLHAWLGVETKFKDWINRRIDEYGFTEKVDWSAFFERQRNAPRNQKDYLISIDMAKELGMVERTDKGREVRQYFIAREKEAKSLASTQQQWSLARAEGKISRRLETDIIKAFVSYAKGQGSQSAEMYYVNFSKMVNAALLDIAGKTPINLRDSLNTIQLHSISVAESIVARTLVEWMNRQLFYKEVYQLTKGRLAAYGLAVGKTRPGISSREHIGLIA